METQSLNVVHRKAVTEVKRLPAQIRAETSNARLPFNYVAAQQAVAECARVDEAKEWANRAEAVASYARQIKDFTMGDNARRIILRATRRMGELFSELQRETMAARALHKKVTKRYIKTGNDEDLRNAEVDAATTRYARVRDDLEAAHRALGSKQKISLAIDVAKVKPNKFEHHCTESPIKTPHQMLVAEGLRNSSGGRSSTMHIFSKGVGCLKIVQQRMPAAEVAASLLDKVNGWPMLTKDVAVLRDWLDEIDRIVEGRKL